MTVRIAAAQLSHETNCFSAVQTDLQAFEASGLYEGAEIAPASRGTNTSFGGFIEGAERNRVELLPLMSVWATPSGMVSASAVSTLTDRLCKLLQHAMLAKPLDGVALALHGAMVTELDDDGDALILETVRATVGDTIPLVSTLDLHANISPRMVAAADLLIGYDTYPHVDMAERAAEAVDRLCQIVRREIHPVTVLIKPPMMPTSQRMTTNMNPMHRLIGRAHEMEQLPGVLAVTVSGGFPPSDTSDTGAAIMVSTNDDPTLAFELAGELATTMWENRNEFLGGVASWDVAATAIAGLQGDESAPLVLVDIGDNPWTGGPGDSAELVRFLLAKQVKNAAVAIVADSESVQQCIGAGVGSRVTLQLGGKTDHLHGSPLPCTGTVRKLTDGRYVNIGPMMAGATVDLGTSAVVEIEGVRVIITSRAESPIDLNVFRSHGIEPTALNVIGLKGKGHFRAAFEPIASQVILVESPGITGSDLARLPLSNVRRPIWPLDPDLCWQFELAMAQTFTAPIRGGDNRHQLPKEARR